MAARAIIAILMMTALSGCASLHYPEYAKGQAACARAAAEAEGQVLAALGQALCSDHPEARTAAAMGLALWMARREPMHLEQPRPGPIEQGLGKLLPGLPMWAAVYGMFHGGVTQAGDRSSASQKVSGNGAGSLNLGSGAARAATAVTPASAAE